MEEDEFQRVTDFLEVLRERRNFLFYKWWGGSPLAYFQNTGEDGLRISWTRSVNHVRDLRNALRGRAAIVVGDVIMSENVNANVPVMSHPDEDEIGMNLRCWLRRVKKNGMKGVMLHFHSEDCLQSALPLVRNAAISGPKILSANVFRLSINSPEPIDFQQFLEMCRDLCPGAIICLGWTDDIRFMISNNVEYSGRYFDIIVAYIGHPRATHVMLSMHATILARSISHVQNLLNQMPNTSLFVWTDEENPVRDVADILAIRGSFPKDLVFYAIPDTQLHGLEWPGLSG